MIPEAYAEADPVETRERSSRHWLGQLLNRAESSTLWSDKAPVRQELFGVERLEQHAESLARAQTVTDHPRAVLSLHVRLGRNAAVLLAAYRESAAELEQGRSIVPAAEWLLDNYHIAEAQIRDIRDDLPSGYYRKLPKLAAGPFAGYPRILGLAWAYVAHTDSNMEAESLRRFVAAYQRVQPLTIGELWAVPITLRIVLVENLRRLADQITAGRLARQEADRWADRLRAVGGPPSELGALVSTLSSEPLSERFAAQLAKRLRDLDPSTTPALAWLEERLRQQSTSSEEVVHHVQLRQGASNVTVRNIVTSMRLASDIEWADLFESVSLVDARLRARSGFARMDFATRNLYRSAIEQLSRGSGASELEIAERALDAAENAATTDDADGERVADPGYHLIAGGRPALERAIDFRPPMRLSWSRFGMRLGIAGYVGAILLLATLLSLLAAFAMASAGGGIVLVALFALTAIVPASEVATVVVNRALTFGFGANALPSLDLKEGVPSSLRTLVVVPTLLTGADDLREQIERLEVHFLSGTGGDIAFALLADGVDAASEIVDGDAGLIGIAAAEIKRLNARHGAGPSGPRFLFLHRRRLFNASEGVWMGWERKRGKLHELNRLLRGATDTSYAGADGSVPSVPAGVRYVITLDADTRLPRDTANRLIAKMAHPLNRPRWSPSARRVVGGHAILQPRVTASLPIGTEGSLYQRVFSAPGGIDAYSAAASDVYQDLFDEGSFTGKGIYDVDAFEAALAGRVPDNTMLSHDLFEGALARSGLVSDIEVVEEFPSRYDVSTRRQHRWVRGDWQLLPWILSLGRGPEHLPAVGRWKMIDNLRRSLISPLALAALWLCWLMPPTAALIGTLAVLAAIGTPTLLPIALSIVPHRSGVMLRGHLVRIAGEIRMAVLQAALLVAFLPDHAWLMGDAIARTLHRLVVTRRLLLEWTTSERSSAAARSGLRGFARSMAGGTMLAALVTASAVVLAPASWPLALSFALLWLAAPLIAWRASQAPKEDVATAPGSEVAVALRLVARRTWRYFETFVTAQENMLPPDNFQEDPHPAVAHRTSPTNIGLYLLAAASARDFGWAGASETADRIEATFASMRRMRRVNGHFLNWYETTSLAVLEPAYVSSVDSGNLAGHLVALANACEEWSAAPVGQGARDGMTDALSLACEALETAAGGGPAKRQIAVTLEEIRARLDDPVAIEAVLPVIARLAGKAADAARLLARADPGQLPPDIVFWTTAIARLAAEDARDRQTPSVGAASLSDRLRAIADEARTFAMAMDFTFLVDRERSLLSIGYAVNDNALDRSCYDLLASEARLASLFAIAKGDVETRHWFRLGRAATPVGNGSALVSWSGSMFEYLMPPLVMRAPTGSLLEQTCRLAVRRQRSYGRGLGIPWGISESAFNARDFEFTYQYSNFGVPGLGLKRGLADNTVIAPYATGLAAMIDPVAALENYGRLAAMGALGRFGYFEALDFTRSRLAKGETFAIVRNVMAHHQGMTIVAIVNTLKNGLMRNRFHREPMIKASELLLQERIPRDVAVLRVRAEEVRSPASISDEGAPAVRRLVATPAGPPVTHLLSNGQYSVMLTATGGGYSRWGEIAVTRWKEDATRDDGGARIFLRDTQSGLTWTAAQHPGRKGSATSSVTFGEDHAEFHHRNETLSTLMDVLVSGEHEGEVRRVSLVNTGRRAREIELTSYAELVLTTAATDAAHPAFAKMFVETEHLPEFGAVLATRRPRSTDEPRVFAAHFAVVEGEIVAEPQFETDRARFFGSATTLAAAAAIAEGQPLSNSVGTVLDPIFSLRQRVAVLAGKTVRVAFWTVVASSRDELMDLVDTHHERSAFERAKTLAWTQAQVQLRHLGVGANEAADFQRLAGPILYADNRFRPPSEAITVGAGPQSDLWPLGISGDLPLVVVSIDDVEDIAQIRQLLRAHEYWRSKQLAVDLVILNDHASSYQDDLQVAIETAVRSSQSRPRLGGSPARGSVFSLRSDRMTPQSRALIRSCARVMLTARQGAIDQQLARLLEPMPIGEAVHPSPARPTRSDVDVPAADEPGEDLEFFNGLGGFAANGREYVTILKAGDATPAPWINVIANAGFGFQVSAKGSGYTWCGNSRENQLTQWSNDPVVDPSGEALYIRDDASGALWSPTAQPIRDDGVYVARHGFGYSRFTHEAQGIASELTQFVPLADPVKISRLTLRNRSGVSRRLTVTAYAEWVLGTARGASGPFLSSELDAAKGVLLVRNPWNMAFPGRVAFADLAGRQTAWTADRRAFLGDGGTPAAPAALMPGASLSRASGSGLDPCAALQRSLTIAPGETVEVVWFLGQCDTVEAVRSLVSRYREADLDAVLDEVHGHWRRMLGAVEVATPDRSMDIMLNGWLLYQTIACRITARSAFYQASGAYGFRDQLQDGMALTFVQPDETRRHLLRAAGRQFEAGDVQHWWLPHSGQGVRTRISDDRVWLAFAAATYVTTSGDLGVLDEDVPFLEGPELREGEHDAFYLPNVAATSASLFEHCARGLDQCLELTGANGLPLMGTGDWNDGMNRVGEAGRGESVWLGWLLVRTIDLFAPLADTRDPERAARWRAHGSRVLAAIEATAWDGEWYRRATFDDGSWLGARGNEACQIDSIAQTWAVLSGRADGERAATAMASLDRHLIRREAGLALLFVPPFDQGPTEPGYIKGYPPGLRENGGQYSHAAMWAILAFAKIGATDRACELFAMLNPINHAASRDAAGRYKVEPYAVAADIYSVPPHEGRGGWTWYTGAAGWMYRAGVEGILGIRKEGDFLAIAPSIPETWPGFTATIRIGSTCYRVTVDNRDKTGSKVIRAMLDGRDLAAGDTGLYVPIDDADHDLTISLPAVLV
ncbi:glucoamylase family protein [Aurantimonas sp. 22II-16-19i]|uniref:GH36-type glycosyl hydrolase domain-containing protein n=1 Tax=Aurantimonas sp. 22II-16-19i TaxID=1317114 RepID=UPI0009F7FF41|nr:glucoamylase family protein [Aurantimonas sp. 22II-16-19i]ORE98122.1 glycosyltransferase [Aurantimonas sp. 22II-16-19i]